MMSDMRSGRIRRVIVYKLDRISRSILDFSSMMEVFEQYRVEFVSTTEKFDTSSPMGRAMLNICVVFAQLERETIQKRVADAYFSRSRKQLYMGGRVPYGYRLVPTMIDNIQTSMYEPIPEEANQIIQIYTLYSDPQCSCGDIAAYLNQQAITKRGKPWGRTRLAELLRNPVYVQADLSIYRFFQQQGVQIVNPPSDFIGSNGCYYYKGRRHSLESQSEDTQGYLVLAPHRGIIPAELWLKCRQKGRTGTRTGSHQKAKHTWLAGKVKCGLCGYALVDKSYGSIHSHYLLCSHKMDSKTCPGPGTIHTDVLEKLVYEALLQKFTQLRPFRYSIHEKPDPRLTELSIALNIAEQEISALLERLSGADEVMYHYIEQRIRQLDQKKEKFRAQIDAISSHNGSKNHCIQLPNWEQLSFSDKRRIADLMIETVHVTQRHVQIQWRI